MTTWKKSAQRGYTLIELLIAVAMAAVVMVSITMTFKSQHDSSLVQEQVTGMQQNVRAAMYVMTRDIQMAGYYTNCANTNYNMDWDDLGDDENIRPMIFGSDNVTGIGGVRANSDVIVIAKAGDEGRALTATESASGSAINLATRDLDGDGDDDLNDAGKSYGLLVTSDLNRAEFFQITGIGADIDIDVALVGGYAPGDFIYRADVIIYRVDDDPDHPSLRRRNLGQDNGYQPVAEDIDQLQFRYFLDTGAWVSDPAGNEAQVRAVEVFLLARTRKPLKGHRDQKTYAMDNGPYGAPPNDAYRRKLLSSIIRTRNIGL